MYVLIDFIHIFIENSSSLSIKECVKVLENSKEQVERNQYSQEHYLHVSA